MKSFLVACTVAATLASGSIGFAAPRGMGRVSANANVPRTTAVRTMRSNRNFRGRSMVNARGMRNGGNYYHHHRHHHHRWH